MSAAFKGLTITIGADTKQFNREMKAVDRSIKETNKQVNELQKSLELEFSAERFAEAQRLAQEAIQGTQVKAQALRDQLKFMEEAGTDKTNQNYQKLQTELIKTETQAVILKKRLEEINNLRIEHIAKQFEKVGQGITKAGQALTPFSAAAAGVLGGLAAIGASTVKSADDLATFAARVNLSAEELQKWQYVAMQTDVSNDELQMGLTKTQSAFGSLAKGELDVASKALLDLGFSAEQAAQGMEANFDQLVQRLAGIEDPILQAAYANDIFGERMGSKLIPLLKAGGDGLAALSEEFKSFGTLSNEQINNLAEFDNVMNRIKFSFKTIKDQIGSALLPVMQQLAGFIQESVIPAVQRMSEWFSNLSTGQQQVLLGTLAFVAALAPALLIIGKLTTGMGALVKGIGGISKALTFLSAHPIIAVIAAVAALVIYLYNTNEQFRESINTLVSTLGAALMPILDILMSSLNSVIQAIMPLINLIGDVLTAAIQTLMVVMKPFLGLFTNVLIPILNFALKIFGSLINLIIGPLTKAMEWLAGLYIKVFEGVQDFIGKTLNFIEKAINKSIDFVNKIIREINKLGDVLGFTIKELNNVKLQAEMGVTYSGSSQKVPDTTVADITPAQAIGQTPATPLPSVVTNNDYSNKNVSISVTVENYAREVDVEDMIRKINTKLAEQF